MNANLTWISFPSPVGALTAYAVNNTLSVLEWGRAPEPKRQPTPLLMNVREQLNAYFDGRLEVFDVPLAPVGTPHQRAVWDAMSAIPYGQTRTYGDIAEDIDSSARAVGVACGKNPIPIIIPCHRVLGGGGRLTGFSGGVGTETKVQLLRLEGISLI